MEAATNKRTAMQHGVTFSAKIAVFVARYRWMTLATSFVTVLALSVVGLYFGEFSVSVDNAGWNSRGTLLANRFSQWLLVHSQLRRDQQNVTLWEDLIENVQPGWETTNDDGDNRRRLQFQGGNDRGMSMSSSWLPRSDTTRNAHRDLQDLANIDLAALNTGVLEGCDPLWYFTSMLDYSPRLWPVWKIVPPSEEETSSILFSHDAIRDICLAEQVTQDKLESEGLCVSCPDSAEASKCLPPFSIVLFARATVPGGFALDCGALATEWIAYTATVPSLEQDLQTCAKDIAADTDYAPFETAFQLPESCPPFFLPFLFDKSFQDSGKLLFTSSVFANSGELRDLYELVDEFGRGSELIEGSYDTQYEEFNVFLVDDAVITDMSLALASAAVTMTAVLIHTRSLWLSVIGFFQIVLSFPLAFFVYKFVFGITFFPFLNFIGVFILFALGADVIFVAVDKWKNARIDLTDSADVTEVAAVALPDAAGAMFLTTFTTAVAFFATSVCAVSPIKCFAIFCGLLISFDYILCCAFIFPALCIYDKSTNCFCSFARRSVTEENTGKEDKMSLIRRFLAGYHGLIHTVRIPLVVICLAAFGFFVWASLTISLPTSADVRLLRESHQFEQNFLGRKELVFSQLLPLEGGTAHMVFGLSPADTGDLIEPTTFTQLVLDEEFEPSDPATQVYIRLLCDKLVTQSSGFAIPDDSSGEVSCPFERLENWLLEQSISESPSEGYLLSCDATASLPIPEDLFHECVSKYALETFDRNFFVRDGVVEIVDFSFKTPVTFQSSYEALDNNLKQLENFTKIELEEIAPQSAGSFYFTSWDFWWHDTNGQLLSTAIIASAIALGTSALVILFSSRSIILTLCSAFSIAFVLASVVATLVYLGWELGFLESICLAVVIGLSADFVIHLSHAYVALPGSVDRSIRTKHAIIRMGPSILAAAFTTIFAAIVMLFCTVTFFTKFATILLVTIVMASFASFVVFVGLMETFGPAEPAYLINQWFPPQPPTTTPGSSINSNSDKDSAAVLKPSVAIPIVSTTEPKPQSMYPQQPFESKEFAQAMQDYEEAFG